MFLRKPEHHRLYELGFISVLGKNQVAMGHSLSVYKFSKATMNKANMNKNTISPPFKCHRI